MSAIPSGFTLPSKIGQVLGLEAIPMLMGMFMTLPNDRSVPKRPLRG
jgi:hypothetical protein